MSDGNKSHGKGPSARHVARRALTRVEQSGAYATLAISAEIARAKLTDMDSRLATELCYGVLRHRSRLDRALAHYMHKGLNKVAPKVLLALRVAAYQILFLDRIPDHAAVDDAVSEVRRIGGPKLAGFANGVLRTLVREGEPELPGGSSKAALMVRYSMPEWIVDLIVERVGPERLEEVLVGMLSVPKVAIRANRQRTTVDSLIKRLQQGEVKTVDRLSDYPWALRVSGLGSPAHSQSFSEGLWTVQDEAAQLISAMAQPRGGQRILDACAGVGGKTTHFAEMDPTLKIDAIDLSPKKIELLEEACKRLGLSSIRACVLDGRRDDEQWQRKGLAAEYDIVLLDAPCSGLGVLRRHPERKWAGQDLGKKINEVVALQKQLLDELCKRVRVGGHLLYSVCTFSAAEGPAQVRDFLVRHPEFEIDPPQEEAGSPQWTALLSDGVFVSWPHESGQDAFFAARLRRR